MKKKIALAVAIAWALLSLGAMSSVTLGAWKLPMPALNTDAGSKAPVNASWAAPAIETNAPVLPAIADVAAAIKPSVVAINTQTTYQMFRRSFSQDGAGSGWIIDDSGIIVTNNHVVADADSITVTLDDGRTFPVDMATIKTDPANDLAILRINASGLHAARIGNVSEVRLGDWVVAIGNPLGMGTSVKEGIISRLDVSLQVEDQSTGHFIETSAAINPGNSGGPLVNMKGEVVGITSAKISSVGVEGLGYAININDAIPSIEALVAGR